MNRFTYKIDKDEEYAIRYNSDRSEEYAKVKGGTEFRTDLEKNRTGYEVMLTGSKVSKEQYEDY